LNSPAAAADFSICSSFFKYNIPDADYDIFTAAIQKREHSLNRIFSGMAEN